MDFPLSPTLSARAVPNHDDSWKVVVEFVWSHIPTEDAAEEFVRHMKQYFETRI